LEVLHRKHAKKIEIVGKEGLIFCAALANGECDMEVRVFLEGGPPTRVRTLTINDPGVAVKCG